MNAPVISPEMNAGPVASPHGPVVITICTTCRKAEAAPDYRPGAVLADAVDALQASGVVIRRTQCLSVCTRACTAALSGAGQYTFLFGDLDPERDAKALVDMAQAMAGQSFGFVPWKLRPEALRSRIIARVPPPEWSPADGSAPA
jgi:predicted metal-binding protein